MANKKEAKENLVRRYNSTTGVAVTVTESKAEKLPPGWQKTKPGRPNTPSEPKPAKDDGKAPAADQKE